MTTNWPKKKKKRLWKLPHSPSRTATWFSIGSIKSLHWSDKTDVIPFSVIMLWNNWWIGMVNKFNFKKPRKKAYTIWKWRNKSIVGIVVMNWVHCIKLQPNAEHYRGWLQSCKNVIIYTYKWVRIKKRRINIFKYFF